MAVTAPAVVVAVAVAVAVVAAVVALGAVVDAASERGGGKTLGKCCLRPLQKHIMWGALRGIARQAAAPKGARTLLSDRLPEVGKSAKNASLTYWFLAPAAGFLFVELFAYHDKKAPREWSHLNEDSTVFSWGVPKAPFSEDATKPRKVQQGIWERYMASRTPSIQEMDDAQSAVVTAQRNTAEQTRLRYAKDGTFKPDGERATQSDAITRYLYN
ncbi:uncharacterized protein MONBRDRAFT_31923 [Monosiga brevicollis MX1]|uniref:Uncharacterized protein n=1 Tax=Monosiga brevicollis TaxID=81824 RepID=A9UWA8_MONBE|nr:uncharacterized protein MONBRDRAFT_31923 [Monosiga brevicollis MX1]EDQ90734.1 predicted protein [Monosiga brevicollis MX1]|eukprot:XP_001744785.1 hypothetical protein [Monosiga brevicollis MX1]